MDTASEVEELDVDIAPAPYSASRGAAKLQVFIGRYRSEVPPPLVHRRLREAHLSKICGQMGKLISVYLLQDESWVLRVELYT